MTDDGMYYYCGVNYIKDIVTSRITGPDNKFAEIIFPTASPSIIHNLNTIDACGEVASTVDYSFALEGTNPIRQTTAMRLYTSTANHKSYIENAASFSHLATASPKWALSSMLAATALNLTLSDSLVSVCSGAKPGCDEVSVPIAITSAGLVLNTTDVQLKDPKETGTKVALKHELSTSTLLINPNKDYAKVSFKGPTILENLSVSSPTITLGGGNDGGLLMGTKSSLIWKTNDGFAKGIIATDRSEWVVNGGNLTLSGPDSNTRFVLAVEDNKLGVYKVLIDDATGNESTTLVTYFK